MVAFIRELILEPTWLYRDNNAIKSTKAFAQLHSGLTSIDNIGRRHSKKSKHKLCRYYLQPSTTIYNEEFVIVLNYRAFV